MNATMTQVRICQDELGFATREGGRYHVGYYVREGDTHRWTPRPRTRYLGSDRDSAIRAIESVRKMGVRIDDKI